MTGLSERQANELTNERVKSKELSSIAQRQRAQILSLTSELTSLRNKEEDSKEKAVQASNHFEKELEKQNKTIAVLENQLWETNSQICDLEDTIEELLKESDDQ